MEQPSSLVQGNIIELEKGLGELQFIPTDIYRQGIGAHYRHVIEFYNALFEGYTAGLVDIVGRERDTHLENHIEAGSQGLLNICSALSTFADENQWHPLLLRDEVKEGVIEDVPHTLSSGLHFLLSHTTHHWWIIRQKAEKLGYEIKDDTFGYSPSTLSYMKQCVR